MRGAQVMSADIFSKILMARGLDTEAKRDAFLHPSYDKKHDPFLLPDMQAAVDRLVQRKASMSKLRFMATMISMDSRRRRYCSTR